MCGKYPVRSFNIFYLAPNTDWSSLFGKDTEGCDLSTLFEYAENQGKILKLSNEIPEEDGEGNFSLRFGRKNIISAV